MDTMTQTHNQATAPDEDIVLSARDVTVAFGEKVILENLSMDVHRGEILGFVGGSGTGKSVLMRTVLGLNRKQSGEVKLFGIDVDQASPVQRMQIDMRMGVLFQHGALFSALSVLENIQVPMREYLDLPKRLMDELALLKIEMVGLATRCSTEVSVRTVRRYDQACGFGARTWPWTQTWCFSTSPHRVSIQSARLISMSW
jgi:phospholipid/cholesterol/gamma-HCH transport system ATP-binding protein